MANEAVGGAVSGAAQGAAAGASVAGPWGALVGGVIGGVGGLFGGNKRKKANKLKKQLKNFSRFVARKELLQQSRLQQAAASNALQSTGAGTERSSGGFGVLASITSQRNSAIRSDNYVSSRTDKIVKLEDQASQIEGLISGASQAVTSINNSLKDFKGGSAEVGNSELMADPNYVSLAGIPKRR